MKKIVILSLVFFSFTLFAQKAKHDDPMPREITDLRDFDPQRYCTKHDVKRALHQIEARSTDSQKTLFDDPRIALYETNGAVWKALGPEGGYIEGMAFNPSNNQEIYALTRRGKVYKTTNAAQNWANIANLDTYVYDLAVGPSNTIYVLSYSAVHKSTDDGLNWDYYFIGDYCSASLGRIAIYQGNPDIICVVGYHTYDTNNYLQDIAVYKSTDGGVNWTIYDLNPTTERGYGRSIAIHPTNPNIIYAGGYEYDGSSYTGKVYKTINGGTAWTDITGSITGYVYALAIDPSNPSKVFAGTNGGIWRSTDEGLNWSMNEGYARSNELAIDPTNSNIIYSGRSETCYKSVDGGVNWVAYSDGIRGNCQNLLASSTNVYFGTYSGVHKSNNGGASWNESHSGMLASRIPAVAVAPSSLNTIYTEVEYNGFFKTDNCGENWTRLPDFYRCESIYKIEINPNNADDLFILAGG